MMDQILSKNKVLICCGSGGVGKTTLSAALGVRAAEIGLKVLVLTIDPAKRLASALGLDTLSHEDVLVPGQNFKGKLFAAIIDPKKVFDSFVLASASSEEEANKIMRNRLYKTLTTSLSGSQEFSSLERLHQAIESKKYDLIILDTPPAQHAQEFLLAPQRFFALFEESVVKWFLTPDSSGGIFSSILHKTTKTVLKALESLTGSEFMNELSTFFIAASDIQGVIQEHSIAIHRHLTGPESGFLVVTSFDAIKLNEARAFHKNLLRGGYQLAGIVINRAFPIWLGETIKNQSHDAHVAETATAFNKLIDTYSTLETYHLGQKHAFDEFERSLEGEVEIFKVPEYLNDLNNIQALAQVSALFKSTGATAR